LLSASEHTLVAGLRVGDYVLEEKIGEGGMGEVWRGFQPNIGKRVAIKVLSEQMLSNQRVIQRFQQEAQAANAIQSRHIVDIFAFGALPDGRPYLVMELLSGLSLASYLEKKGPLPLGEIVELFSQICKALGAAHERGIVHRDLKPENVFLVMEEGDPPFVKILDFGIAKLASDGGAGRLTRTGSVFGTPAYMSPEQCEGSKQVDHRADLYALGIILFELLTGRTPFYEPGDGLGSVIARHLHSPPNKVSEMVYGREISPALDAFVTQRVLAKSPDDRPQRCADLLAELRAVAADGERSFTVARPKTERPPYRTPAPSSAQVTATVFEKKNLSRPDDYYAGDRPASGSRRRGLWLAGLGVALLLGLALSLSFRMESGDAGVSFSITREPELPQSAPQTSPASVASPAPARVKLRIDSTPSQALVSLDGEALGETPLETEVAFGTEPRRLSLSKEGFVLKEIDFTPDAALQAVYPLEKAPKEAANPGTAKKAPDKKPKEKTPTGKNLIFDPKTGLYVAPGSP
jgi:serine/threonine-protein kinase